MNFPKIQLPRSSLILICILAVFAAAVAACGTSGGVPVPVKGTTTEKISSTTTCAESETVREQPPNAAGIDPFGSGPWYVNEDRNIWVGWGSGPSWVKGQNKKVVWVKPAGSPLIISGRRLNPDAEPMIAEQPGDYSSFGYDPTNLFFPTGGCWEIKGKVGVASITFVTRVRG